MYINSAPIYFFRPPPSFGFLAGSGLVIVTAKFCREGVARFEAGIQHFAAVTGTETFPFFVPEALLCRHLGVAIAPLVAFAIFAGVVLGGEIVTTRLGAFARFVAVACLGAGGTGVAGGGGRRAFVVAGDFIAVAVFEDEAADVRHCVAGCVGLAVGGIIGGGCGSMVAHTIRRCKTFEDGGDGSAVVDVVVWEEEA